MFKGSNYPEVSEQKCKAIGISVINLQQFLVSVYDTPYRSGFHGKSWPPSITRKLEALLENSPPIDSEAAIQYSLEVAERMLDQEKTLATAATRTPAEHYQKNKEWAARLRKKEEELDRKLENHELDVKQFELNVKTDAEKRTDEMYAKRKQVLDATNLGLKLQMQMEEEQWLRQRYRMEKDLRNRAKKLRTGEEKLEEKEKTVKEARSKILKIEQMQQEHRQQDHGCV